MSEKTLHFDAITRRVTVSLSEIVSLKAQIVSLNEEINSQKHKISSLEGENSSQKKQIVSLADETSSQKKEITALKLQRDKDQQTISGQEKIIFQKERDLQSHTKEIAALNISAAEVKSAHAKLEKELAKTNDAHQKSEHARKQAESESKNLQSELQATRREILLMQESVPSGKEQPAKQGVEKDSIIDEKTSNEGKEIKFPEA